MPGDCDYSLLAGEVFGVSWSVASSAAFPKSGQEGLAIQLRAVLAQPLSDLVTWKNTELGATPLKSPINLVYRTILDRACERKMRASGGRKGNRGCSMEMEKEARRS